MYNSIPLIPNMKVGLVVVTPNKYENITANKKYVVEGISEGGIQIRNDVGILESYYAYRFIEADLYFTTGLFSTVIKLFKLKHRDI